MTFEEVSKYYKVTQSLKKTSAHFEISGGKTRKILITTGDFQSPRSIEIATMIENGMSKEEIAKALRISNTTVNNYTPYTKCLYNSDTPSLNALLIRKCRANKAKTS